MKAKNNVVKFIVSIVLPLAVGGISGYFTSSGVGGWYQTLVKPSFNPPNWVFAPAWTLLYIMMGIAFFLIWKKDVSADKKRWAIFCFAVQLTLNFLWSFVFFYLEQPGWALVEILVIWVMILATILAFKKLSTPAALLLVPYLLWVSFATLLTYSIWQLN